MAKDDINIKWIKKIHNINTCGASLKAFEILCAECKTASDCGTCKSILPVKHVMTEATERKVRAYHNWAN